MPNQIPQMVVSSAGLVGKMYGGQEPVSESPRHIGNSMHTISMPYLRAVFLVVLLAIVSCVGCAGGEYRPLSFPARSTLDHDLRSTAVLLAYRGHDEWRGTVCAAVFISKHQMVTAHHCAVAGAFSEAETIGSDLGLEPPPNPTGRPMRYTVYDEVVTNNGTKLAEQFAAVVERVDYKNDLALLYTADDAPAWVTVSDTQLDLGDSVVAVGHPSALWYTVSWGHVSNPRRTLFEETPLFTQVDLSVYHGNSGGGLFNDAGELVGVCSAMGDVPNEAFFIHLEKVQALIKG